MNKTPLFSQEIKKHLNGKTPFISLGLGEKELDTPENIKLAAKTAIDEGLTRYSSAQGIPELRTALAKELGTQAENIVITPGAKNALFLVSLSLLQPGDEVVLLTPCYLSYAPMMGFAQSQVKIKSVALNEEFRLDTAALQRAVGKKTRLLVINFPHNPTGRLLSQEEVNFLHELLLTNPQLYIVSDEVYRQMVFFDKTNFQLDFSDTASQVVRVGSFSKAYSMTGWRIGYFQGNLDIVNKVIERNLHINMNVPAFTQKAALEALLRNQKDIDLYNTQLEDRVGLYRGFLEKSAIFSGPIPDGGFFAFMDISQTGLSSDAFAAQLLKSQHVALNPGIIFGDNYDGFCRLSLAVSTTDFSEALNRIESFVKEV